MRSIARTEKILAFLSCLGECRQQNKTKQNKQRNKNTQHAPSTKTECDCLYVWIKKTVTCAKVSPPPPPKKKKKQTKKNGQPQRYIWERWRKRRRRNGPAIIVTATDSYILTTFLAEYVQLILLPRIKNFSLPISVTWPVYRNVKDEESSLGIGLKGIYISSVSSEWHAHELKT